uniref:Putative secreted protein n=1 Tax=Anopheles darlingi TaxID=43151 RepID=A0A2M4D721_ANODA
MMVEVVVEVVVGRSLLLLLLLLMLLMLLLLGLVEDGNKICATGAGAGGRGRSVAGATAGGKEGMAAAGVFGFRPPVCCCPSSAGSITTLCTLLLWVAGCRSRSFLTGLSLPPFCTTVLPPEPMPPPPPPAPPPVPPLPPIWLNCSPRRYSSNRRWYSPDGSQRSRSARYWSG